MPEIVISDVQHRVTQRDKIKHGNMYIIIFKNI